MVWRIKPQQKYCDCLNIDYILVSCWKVKCSSTFHLRSSFSLPFCGGTPLAPWTLIEIPRTQFGLHIHSVVDMWLQLLMVYQNVLFFQWKGMNWILSKGRLKKKKISTALMPARTISGKLLKQPIFRHILPLTSRCFLLCAPCMWDSLFGSCGPKWYCRSSHCLSLEHQKEAQVSLWKRTKEKIIWYICTCH